MMFNRSISLLITILALYATPQAIEAQGSPLDRLWKYARNAKDSSLLELYTKEAVKVISADEIVTGREAILEHYGPKEAISQVHAMFSTDANIHRGISYATTAVITENAPTRIQLVIYEKSGEQKLRAFEYDADQPIEISKSDSEEIIRQLRERRAQWMAYCNAHDVPGLIYDLYSHNTLYFNHRPLVKGRKALVQEYAYMNNEQYKLELIPSFLSVVNDSTVFEIGQCEGSYNGKYILIWKKEDDGVWRIFIDSNV